MRTRLLTITVWLAAGLLSAAAPAEAQYGARRATSERATGETFHVEVKGAFWNPSPDIVISSEQFDILGSDVDFVNTLGVTDTRFKQLKVALRAATKHKFRFEYTPLNYDAQKVITAQFTWNGQLFQVGIPVTTNLKWNAYRFGYEWDFIYRSRGFLGLLLDVKYTDVSATLSSPAVGAEQFTHAEAPIPAIGVIGRGYVVPNISITGEFSAFRLPERAIESEDYSGRYYDFDLYGTVNFTDHFGAELGYRSWDVFYKVKKDSGTLHLTGPYFGGVLRF
jgi:hypothetical protein